MLNMAKLKIGNRVYNINEAVRERGVVQSITPTGKVRVKYENGKTRLHAAAQLTRMPHTVVKKTKVQKTKKEMEQKITTALDILEKLPTEERATTWKAVVSTGLTIREVLEVKGLLP